MNALSRRSLLVQLAGFACGAALTGCNRTPTRQGALRDLVARVAVPDTRRIARESRALAEAVAGLSDQPGAAQLGEVRGMFRRTALAWQRAYGFKQGPIVTTHALLRATFWPARRPAMAALLGDRKPIDGARVAMLGVDVKGLFALEHLLFETSPAGEPWLSGSARARALELARALSRDVQALAESAEQALGDGASFAREFAQGGQDSVNRVVNEMLATVESAVAGRLDRVLAAQRDGTLDPAQVHGAPSGISSDIPRVWLEVCAELYGGDEAGLGQLVAHAAPALHAPLVRSFSSAVSALRELDGPLERVARGRPRQLESAARRVKDLEAAMRAELASALAVTLTFTSTDGD